MVATPFATMRLGAAIVGLVFASGCAHVVSNEERLDEATSGLDTKSDERELKGVDCLATNDDVKRAHDDALQPAVRKQHYDAAVERIGDKVKQFDEAFTQNPDLLYSANGPDLQRRRDRCATQLTALAKEKDFFASIAPAPAAPAVAPKPVAEPTKKAVTADAAFADDDAPTTVSKTSKSKKVAKKKRIAKGSKKRLPRTQYAAAADDD